MTEIVGILNLTEDSFSDGGQYNNVAKAQKRVQQLFEEGADMIDIGAESTRPGAKEVAVIEEWNRLAPVVKSLKKHFSPEKFSIDTRHSEIVERVIDLWSPELTINDVTGLHSERMVEIVANNSLKVIISHLPEIAHGDIAKAHKIKMTHQQQVRDDLITKYIKVVTQGVGWENIMIDPGIGFGKAPQLNKDLLSFASLVPNIPVMIGYSRKRFLGARRMQEPANVRAGLVAAKSGAARLRVHDVVAHVEMLKDLSS